MQPKSVFDVFEKPAASWRDDVFVWFCIFLHSSMFYSFWADFRVCQSKHRSELWSPVAKTTVLQL